MAHGKLLIVDDEEDILEVLSYMLSREGYTVVTAETGEKCVELASSHLPDLILLDLMLPGIDGRDVCGILKNDPRLKHIPVIMLTAKAEESDVVAGLEVGADDYVAKPFSPGILLARVKAMLRRRKAAAVMSGVGVIENGGITLDLDRREATVDGSPVELTFTEFEVLRLFLKKPGVVFTRQQIVNDTKGADYAVTDRSVDVQIVGLRRKLGDEGLRIETVRGVGYKLRV